MGTLLSGKISLRLSHRLKSCFECLRFIVEKGSLIYKQWRRHWLFLSLAQQFAILNYLYKALNTVSGTYKCETNVCCYDDVDDDEVS